VAALARAARMAVGRLPFHGMFASGGDMATGLLREFGAVGFAVEFAVQPLVVTGRLTGGLRDDLPFATKGGLIGDPDAVTETVLQLQSMPTVAPPGRTVPGDRRGQGCDHIPFSEQEVVP
jgi:uncharacterized protein YgbK (DUF1537 family)